MDAVHKISLPKCICLKSNYRSSHNSFQTSMQNHTEQNLLNVQLSKITSEPYYVTNIKRNYRHYNSSVTFVLKFCTCYSHK